MALPGAPAVPAAPPPGGAVRPEQGDQDDLVRGRVGQGVGGARRRRDGRQPAVLAEEAVLSNADGAEQVVDPRSGERHVQAGAPGAADGGRLGVDAGPLDDQGVRDGAAVGGDEAHRTPGGDGHPGRSQGPLGQVHPHHLGRAGLVERPGLSDARAPVARQRAEAERDEQRQQREEPAAPN